MAIVEILEYDKIEEIAKMPTVVDNVHESVYRSYATMNLMCEMLERGDSKETILMTIRHIGLDQTEEKDTDRY